MQVQCYINVNTMYLYKYIVYAWYMHGIYMVYVFKPYLYPI